MKHWPKITSEEEYVEALPSLRQLARRFSCQVARFNVDSEDVFARMMEGIHKNRFRIPKETGQAAYVYRIFRTCLSEERRLAGRLRKTRQALRDSWMYGCESTICDKGPDGERFAGYETPSPLPDRPGRHGPSLAERAVNRREVHVALKKLSRRYRIHVRILRLRFLEQNTWREISDRVHLCIRRCQQYYRIIKQEFAALFPELRELIGEM